MDDFTRRMIMGAAGAAGGKTYVDDVFSTYLYNGDGTTSNAIDIGVDLTEGGLVWLKSRSDTMEHYLFDTARGATKYLNCATNANEGTSGQSLKSFNNNGFTLGDNGAVNSPSRDMTSWTFRKAPGFFDVVTFTSTGAANQRIPHGLECEPGVIICKSLTGTSYWVVYHKEIARLNPGDPWSKCLLLDENYTASTLASDTWGTGPTSTDFGFKAGGFAGTGTEWVAYVFAGGASSAATATSCNFLGTSAGGNYDNNKIFCGTTNGTKTAELVYGTGDFTWEAWVRCESSSNIYRRIFHHGQEWTNGTALGFNWDNNNNQNQFSLWSYNLSSNSAIVSSQTHNFDDDGQWHHVAVSRQSGTFRIFVDGVLEGTNSSYSGSTESVSTNYLTIGATHNANVQECFKGNISNVRIVKGTALYTSSFIPPYEPLTNVTNTVLLCCNGSSVTSATVTPITLTVGDSSVTASTDSPFDDPEGFKFGAEETQNIIKTSSYIGNASSNGPVVNLGWEPQWILIKNTLSSQDWMLFDSMRGISDGYDDAWLEPNTNDSEDVHNFIDITPTGFRVSSSSALVNGASDPMVYIAMRRPDGYVGKPPELGNQVFSPVYGSANAPMFKSNNHVVDFTLQKNSNFATQATDWNSTIRLTSGRRIKPNTTNAEDGNTYQVFDYQSGASSYASGSGIRFGWLWKRSAGLDVVTYVGNSTGDYSGMSQSIPHNLGKSPEMIWAKKRNGSGYWGVYHKGLNGGTNPENYRLLLNDTHAESAASGSYTNWYWNNTAPTATHFSVGEVPNVNDNNMNLIATLFASVDGISKVGRYTGTGSSGNSVSLGFQPRFLLVKNADWSSGDWFVYDTTRGWASGNDSTVILNSTATQVTGSTWDIDPTSTGFTVQSTDAAVNQNGHNFIYYAHA